jgi:hypothetical protein
MRSLATSHAELSDEVQMPVEDRLLVAVRVAAVGISIR